MLDIKSEVIDYLSQKEDPIKLNSIAKSLGLDQRDDRQYLKSILAELVKEGRVSKSDKRYWVPDGKHIALQLKREKTRRAKELCGRISIIAKGDGFVENKTGKDWYIPPQALNGASHGDVVRARMVELGSGDRIVGEVAEIESFGLQRLAGVFEKTKYGAMFHPFKKVSIRASALGRFPRDVKDGDVGVFQRAEDGKWQFETILGTIEEPEVDEAIVLAENAIPNQFSEAVLAEATRFHADYEFDPAGREDFRGELVFTVDGADARDFDDALHFKVLDDDRIEVGIHIADVSEFVKPGTALDEWAAQQGNSTYLPHKALPMLPPILSNELCSLKPDVPRYTLSVVVVLERDGTLVSQRIHKGFIRSRYRLTYDDVVAIGLDGENRIPEIHDSIQLGLELSRALHRRRRAAGGLAFEISESRITLNPDQTLGTVFQSVPTDANRMIEAFMCLANEVVAEYLTPVGLPFRIHEAPELKKLETLVKFLSAYEVNVPEDIFLQTGRALNRVIKQLTDFPNPKVMQTQILKMLKMAEYSPENRGHFGLASNCYTHFTSPIRRYADLIVHRRLSLLLENPRIGPEHFDNEDLAGVCEHISGKERASASAEQSFKQIKLIRHLLGQVGECFDGTIVEIKNYGLFVTLDAWNATGLVHVDNLNEEVEFHPQSLALVGRRSGNAYRVGQSVRVRLAGANYLTRELDLELLEAPSRAVKRPPARGFQKSNSRRPTHAGKRSSGRETRHGGEKRGRPSRFLKSKNSKKKKR